MASKGPEIELDWELGVFRVLRGLARKLIPAKALPYDESTVVFLEDLAPRLRVLAQVLAGENLRIQPSDGVGGIREQDLLLPRYADLADSRAGNRRLYTLRVALHVAQRERLRERGSMVDGDPMLTWCRVTSEAVRALSSSMPRFSELYAEACRWELMRRPPMESLGGRASQEEVVRRALLAGVDLAGDEARVLAPLAGQAKGPSSPEVWIWGRPIAWTVQALGQDSAGAAPPAAGGTEEEAPAFEELRILLLDEEEVEELPVHVFEKVETAENWSGGMRPMDGSDELDEQLEALEEVDLRDLVRGGEQAHSVLRADIVMDTELPDVSRLSPGENGIAYDEWNRKTGSYRKNWTRVYPTVMPQASTGWVDDRLRAHSRLIDDLYGRLRRHRDQLRPMARQLDGEEVDIDALTEEMASVRGGHGGHQRLYVRADRRQRDHATIVLLDISLSTDSYVGERRVIDVARDAALVLGEVAERLGDQIRVMAFASHTRNQVRVWDVRDWKEPWIQSRSRLGLLAPQGYTRIGPALRHATAEFEKIKARRKLLLLISDGKPTDYDRYEGRYGVADVRQAIREAHSTGVSVHGLAIEAAARDYLPGMLGPGAWHLMPQAELLPELAATVYGRLTGR